MTNDELREEIDDFIRITKTVFTPRRPPLSWLFGRGGFDEYLPTVRLRSPAMVKYAMLAPMEASESDEQVSPEFFQGFGEKLADENDIPEIILVARMTLQGEREVLVIEACSPNNRWARAFLPLMRDKFNLLQVAGDPKYETPDRVISNLRWNAATEVMRGFLE